MNKNICITTDAYKISHWLQRPKGLTKLYSYGEPRVGGKYKKINFFGLQPHVAEQIVNGVVTTEMIEEAQQECISTFGTVNFFNHNYWNKVRDLGYHPIKIMTAPEGMWVEEGNVCFTIENTKDWAAGMVSHYEDILLWSWYTSAVSTRSGNMKKEILPIFQEFSDNPELIAVALNDFGLRGCTAFDSAVLGGMAHLVHFQGSDNMPASLNINKYYGLQGRALSVYATEHSTATAYGPGRGEFEYVKAQLSQFRDCIKSIVIDSYDADNFMQNVVCSEEIKALIKAHEGRVVWRPDSGDALRNITKYSDILGASFGFSINSKGKKVINDNQGFIQGDGINEVTGPQLYRDYVATGWAPDNLLLGSGGGLLVEGLTRDTSRWAVKASYAEFDGVPKNLFKAPKTDPTKNSKSGRVKLHELGRFGGMMTIESSKESTFGSFDDSLKVLYEDGKFYPDTFTNIIERANGKY